MTGFATSSAELGLGLTLASDKAPTELQFEDYYYLGERFAGGAFGEVHVAEHKTTDQEFAVKIIDRCKLSEKSNAHLIREVGILKDCRNLDGIVRLVDFYDTPERFYVVQVYARGGDVFERLANREKYNEKDARDFALCLIKALAALHEKKIAHRDLKPENLLLRSRDDDSEILVADFGFATYVGYDGLSTRCGTPSFVAPEILNPEENYDERADCWSAGCILYMLIGGYPPFQAANQRELFRAIRGADFCFHEQFWSTVSVSAKKLIAGLLTVDPEFRCTAANALKSDWLKITDKKLMQSNLNLAIGQMQKFNARRSLKSAMNTVLFSVKTSALRNSLKTQKAGDGAFAKTDTLLDKIHTDPKFADAYDLGQVLYEGATCTVWEATHKEKGGNYAVKMVDRELIDPNRDAKSLSDGVLHEVAVLRSLDHPYIIKIEDFFDEEDNYYIVMERMEGIDLFERLDQLESYTEDDARILAKFLLEAVAYLHKRGICHRDLKPENILLKSMDDNADIKIADFSLACRVHTPQSLTRRCGTPHYVSPEILKNIPYDQSTDMWSVGVIIYNLLCGYMPFDNSDLNELCSIIRSGRYDFESPEWNYVSDDAKDLIRHLLLTNPERRWSAAVALKSRWFREDRDNLVSNDLSKNLAGMKAKRKLKNAAKKVMLMNSLSRLASVTKLATVGADTIFDLPESVSTGLTLVSEHAPSTLSFHRHYEIGDRFAGGAFGEVHVAEHIASKEEYAVKVIDRSKLSEKSNASLLREVGILRDCRGIDGIVRLVDFYDTTRFFYVVQDYAKGGDVFERLANREKYSEKNARDFAVCLLRGIAALHEKKIAHRDLKPENLLLRSRDDDSEILVADFGFATYVGENGLTTRCGTPSFVAPEILDPESHYNELADCWSAGCILYMLLGGYPPFQAANQRELFTAIRGADFCFHEQYWSKVSIPAKKLIASLLTVDPRYRTSAAKALESDWLKLQDAALEKSDLGLAIGEMKKFNARSSLRSAMNTVLFSVKSSMILAGAKKGDENAAFVKTDQLLDSVEKAKTFDETYERGLELYDGSTCTVWDCTHREKGGDYAVKIIDHDTDVPNTDSKAFSDGVLHEVAVLRGLDHPYIIKIVDFFDEEDHYFIVMERMDGVDLFERLDQLERYTEKDARDLAKFLLEAVAYMHSKGICHRDLKPENILLKSLDDNSDIKIADFSLACRVHTPQSLTRRCGTPHYVSPEILKNVPYDESTDMWSVGVIIYNLLSGFMPFDDNDLTELCSMIRAGKYDFDTPEWEFVTDNAKDLIRHLLVTNPEQRWSAQAALRSKWFRDDADNLVSHDLSKNLEAMKGRRRLKNAAKKVMLMNSISRLASITRLAPPTTVSGETMYSLPF